MPSIPDPNELTRRPMSGRTSIANVQTGGVERATANAYAQQGEQARAMGNAVAQFGQNVAQMAEKEKERLDDERFKEARNNALVSSNALWLNAQKIQGSDVVKNDFLKVQLAELDKATSAQFSQLSNDTQKNKFKAWSDEHRVIYGKEVATHAARETDKLADSTYKGALAAYTEMATTTPTSTSWTATGVEGVRNTLMNELTRQGLDPVLIEQKGREAAGVVHGRVIATLRAKGNIAYANQYLKENMADMTDVQRTTAEESLREVTEYDQAVSVGSTAADMVEAGASPLEVDKFIGTQKLTKGALATAKLLVKERAAALTATHKDIVGGIFEDFYKTDRSTTSVLKALTSEGYMSLPADKRVEARAYLEQVSRVRDAENDEKRREAQAKLENSPHSMAIMGDALDRPEQIARMSMTQIRAIEPKIGKANADKLIVLRRAILADAASFKIDPGVLSEALAGVKDKATQKTLKGHIAMKLMDFKQQNPGVNPTPEQQAEIARAGQETFVRVKNWWPDSEVPSHEVKPGDTAFPLAFGEQFPGKDNDEVLDYYTEFVAAYTTGVKALKKGEVPPTREQVMARFIARKNAK